MVSFDFAKGTCWRMNPTVFCQLGTAPGVSICVSWESCRACRCHRSALCCELIYVWLFQNQHLITEWKLNLILEKIKYPFFCIILCSASTDASRTAWLNQEIFQGKTTWKWVERESAFTVLCLNSTHWEVLALRGANTAWGWNSSGGPAELRADRKHQISALQQARRHPSSKHRHCTQGHWYISREWSDLGGQSQQGGSASPQPRLSKEADIKLQRSTWHQVHPHRPDWGPTNPYCAHQRHRAPPYPSSTWVPGAPLPHCSSPCLSSQECSECKSWQLPKPAFTLI